MGLIANMEKAAASLTLTCIIITLFLRAMILISSTKVLTIGPFRPALVMKML